MVSPLELVQGEAADEEERADELARQLAGGGPAGAQGVAVGADAKLVRMKNADALSDAEFDVMRRFTDESVEEATLYHNLHHEQDADEARRELAVKRALARSLGRGEMPSFSPRTRGIFHPLF